MATTIPVYIITYGNPESSYVAKLVALFDSDYFQVTVIKSEGDQQGFTYALSDAKDKAPDLPCIIIKDCMFSNLSSSDMTQLIQTILDSNLAWDLCYLARYLDRCNGSIVLPDVTTGGALVTTTSAEGDDAIMYSPRARDKLLDELNHKKHNISDILHRLLKDGSLQGTAMSPPVIQYNPVFGEFKKTWECEGHKPHPQPPDNNDNTTYLWVFMVMFFLIILILIIWFFFW